MNAIEKYRQKPVEEKLGGTFGAMVVMLLIISFSAIAALIFNSSRFREFYETPYVISTKCAELQTEIQEVSKNIAYALVAEESGHTQEYLDTAQEALTKLQEGTTFLREEFPQADSIIDEYDALMLTIKDDRAEVFEYAVANRTQEAQEVYFNSLMPGYVEASGYLDEIAALADAEAASSYEMADLMKNIIIVVIVLISIVSVLAAYTLSKLIVRGLVPPIEELEKAAKQMAEGQLDVSVTYENTDELGGLAEAMRALTNRVRVIIHDMYAMLEKMGDGDFQVHSEIGREAYVGDFAALAESIIFIRDHLNGTMLRIEEASTQVSMGSGQMAQTAQTLAEGATDQAGAVEELNATIASIYSQSQQSADMAKQAHTEVEEAVDAAQGGYQKMVNLSAAMERINQISQEVGQIVGEIEDIASQTNLLSLNASIEAARAGEAGRGFAVVADQIGKLAADSAKSAANTRDLITKALQEIAGGNTMTTETEQAFDEVITSMNKFAGVAQQTRTNAEEQAGSLQQVLAGVEQIASVTQNNSAAAQETSATSQELSAQAQTLQGEVDKFKLIR